MAIDPNTTSQQALTQVLILALTAPTKQDSKRAIKLASSFAGDVSEADISICKEVAARVFEILNSSSFAVVPNTIALHPSLTLVEIGRTNFNETQTLLAFPNIDARNGFLKAVSAGSIPKAHDLSVFLAARVEASLLNAPASSSL